MLKAIRLAVAGTKPTRALQHGALPLLVDSEHAASIAAEGPSTSSPCKMNSWHGRTHHELRAFIRCAAQSSFALAWRKGAIQVRTVPRKQLRISLSLNRVRSSLIMASTVLEATCSTLGSKQCAAGKREGRMVQEC